MTPRPPRQPLPPLSVFGHPCLRIPTPPPRAFTLAELIIAIVIAAFIGVAAIVALSQAARARDASAARLQAFLRAESAVSQIALDAENALRDHEVYFTRVLVTSMGTPPFRRDELLLFSRSMRLVRPPDDQAEGGEYEVQFRLQPSPTLSRPPPRATRGGQPVPSFTLWRRADPVPDEFPDAGGVASALSHGIASLEILAADSASWFRAWDSDRDGYPHALSITVTATDDAGRYPISARRIVALDRTPLPKNPVVIDETSTTSENPGGAP